MRKERNGKQEKMMAEEEERKQESRRRGEGEKDDGGGKEKLEKTRRQDKGREFTWSGQVSRQDHDCSPQGKVEKQASKPQVSENDGVPPNPSCHLQKFNKSASHLKLWCLED